MDWISNVGQLILSLSILVILHECGHFIPARLFGTRVEKFYLFFDPWFSLFKFKKGDTEYGVGWLPLGGYVKISGMIDESMDKEQMSKEPQPWEFRAKPAWQRLIIMIGGVTVNMLLAIVIYIMIAFVWGSEYIPNDQLPYGIYADSMAQSIGLQNGDKVVKVNGLEVEKFNDIRKAMSQEENTVIEVNRAGQHIRIDVPITFVAAVLENENFQFIQPALITKVAMVQEGSNAEKAGLKVGDVIIGLENEPTPYYGDVVQYLRANPGKPVKVGVKRGNEVISLHAETSEEGTLGFKIDPDQLPIMTESFTFFESIPKGIQMGTNAFTSYLKQLKLMFNPETKAYKAMGGFMMIGKAFGSTWDWERFWNLTAFISVILAIMNLLPIPALDGGHVMFLLYEIIVGRKPHDKVMEYAQILGMLLLFALLILVNANDVIKHFSK